MKILPLGDRRGIPDCHSIQKVTFWLASSINKFQSCKKQAKTVRMWCSINEDSVRAMRDSSLWNFASMEYCPSYIRIWTVCSRKGKCSRNRKQGSTAIRWSKYWKLWRKKKSFIESNTNLNKCQIAQYFHLLRIQTQSWWFWACHPEERNTSPEKECLWNSQLSCSRGNLKKGL